MHSSSPRILRSPRRFSPPSRGHRRNLSRRVHRNILFRRERSVSLSQHDKNAHCLVRKVRRRSLGSHRGREDTVTRSTAVSSEAWAKLRDWASVAGRGWLLLSGSVAHASLKTAVW